MSRILVLYSTVDGHTLEICEHLARVIGTQQQVSLVAIEDSDTLDLSLFEKIIIGASIRYGKHRKNVHQFIEANRTLLEQRPNAFFSVNAVARKPTRNTPETNPYLKRFLSQISWRPAHLAVFAGKIDYQRYRYFDRQLIRLIMWMTKGPTDPYAIVDFTDWDAVTAFGRKIAQM